MQVVRAIAGAAPARHARHGSLDSGVELSFRLYKYDSGSLNRVAVGDQALDKAFAEQNAMAWEQVQSPKIAAVNK